MRAAVATERTGDQLCVNYVNAPRPKLEPYQVLVQIRACALSEVDVAVLRGELSSLAAPPLVPGYEVSGVVRDKGTEVSNLEVGDSVVAMLPLDQPNGGCAEFCVVEASHAVRKPEILSHEDAAAVIHSGLVAYTACHYLMRVQPDDLVLLCPPARCTEALAAQVIGAVGAKIMVAVSTQEAFNLFSDCGPYVVRVIDARSESVVTAIMEETGGTGVNHVLDLQAAFERRISTRDLLGDHETEAGQHAGSQTSERKEDTDNQDSHEQQTEFTPAVSKRDIIRCLAAQGRWVTNWPSFQLDPLESEQLYLRGASVSFVFPQVWLLAPTQLGRYTHIMQDLMDKAAKGVFRAALKPQGYSLDKIKQAYRDLEAEGVGRVVISM